MFQKICPRPANPNVVCVYNSVFSCVRWGLAWAWAVFCLFAGSSAFADPSFIKNPAAATPLGGATGFESSMSVSANGEGYITTRGTPIPIVISPNATPQNVLIAPVGSQTPVPVIGSKSTNTAADTVGLSVLPVYRSTPSAVITPNANLNMAANGYGALYCDFAQQFQGNGVQAQTPVKLEDVGMGEGEAVMMMGSRQIRTQAANPGSDGDASFINSDNVGRVYVNAFGSGVGEWYQSCSSAATGTSDTAIKAAVASNRIYVTSLSCSNDSDVTSMITFKDGTSAIWTGYVTKNSVGPSSWTQTFWVPLRGSVATALNFAMTTNSTSTICCAAGYISVN